MFEPARNLYGGTRHVSPTLDGEAYYRRCVTLIADVAELHSSARP
jgi:DNA-binding transcriptional LysR family regulator